MIKVDCSGENQGLIEMRGTNNLVLNELRCLTIYAIKLLGPVALDAINDGATEFLEELGGEHDTI